MSAPAAPEPARLVVGVLTGAPGCLPAVAEALVRHFGPLDLVSRWTPFTWTDYYAAEMGPVLQRRLLVFKEPVDPGRLAAVKVTTNGVEALHAVGGRRRVNLDPGLLSRERYVLATGKNFTHRVYLGQGIYADLTLIYRHGAFAPLPWTYPDYAADEMRGLLGVLRAKYLRDLKRIGRGGGEENA